MAERSYNGWVASQSRQAIGVVPMTVQGGEFPGGVKSGDVTAVLQYVAEQFHARVERIVPGWCWGYNYRKNRNADNLSCHSSGTAIDLNAPRHPNGKRGTFSAAQVKTIRAILADCGGVVQWGGDFRGTPDEMHFEILGSAADVATVAQRLRGGANLFAPEEEDMTPEQSNKLDALYTHVMEQERPAGQGYSWSHANSDKLDAVLQTLQGPDERWDMLTQILSWMPALASKGETGGIDVDALASQLSKALGDDLAQSLGKKLAA